MVDSGKQVDQANQAGQADQTKADLPSQPADASQDSPKFGRLLVVLLFAVAVIVAITFATEAYHRASPI